MNHSINELKKQIAQIPKLTGVYLFKDENNQILYIGKAVSLRDRVSSYLSPRLAEERGSHLLEMISLAKKIEYQLTDYEIAALLLEAKLIRQHKPKYNIKLRDDKSFAVIAIDYNCDYPPIMVRREKDLEQTLSKLQRDRSEKISQKVENIEYFGPYMSTNSVKHTLTILRKAFKFCDCPPEKLKRYQKANRGCFYYSLGQCSGACLNKVTPSEYREQIEPLRQFLKGNQPKVISSLEKEMKKATDKEEFEKAARLRDQISALAKIQHAAFLATKAVYPSKQFESGFRIEAYDVSNISGQFGVGSMIVSFISQGELNLAKHFYRRFKIKTVQGADDLAMIKEVLNRRLKRLNNKPTLDWQKPDLILIDGGKAHLQAVKAICRELNLDLPIIAVAKGPSRKKVDLYYQFDLADLKKEELNSPDQLKKVAEKLREEAHRFAISYYRTLHRKSLFDRK